MPPKPQSRLLELIDADDSEDEFAFDHPVAVKPKATATKVTKEKMPAAKKTGGRAAAATKKTTAAANKVTKPAQKKTASSGRRTSGRIAAVIEATPEVQEIMPAKPPAKGTAAAKPRGRKVAAAPDLEMEAPEPAAPKARGGRGRPRKAPIEEEDVTEIPETQQSPPKPAPAKRGRKPKARVEEDETEIPETQQPQVADDEMMIDELEPTMDLTEEEHNVPGAFPSETVPRSIRGPDRGAIPLGYAKPARNTRQPTRYEDDELTNQLRRDQLSLEERYKNLENRHRDVRDTAVLEAERNFDRLKQQTDERAAVADKLIASLKSELEALRAELSAQKKQVTQTISEKAKLESSYKAELDTSTAANRKLQTQVSDLTKSLAEVTKSLSDSKKENKNLANKLAAARTTEAAKAVAVVPGSAIKGSGSTIASRQQNADALHAARQMQLKEDMYADLTALIVRGVKKEGDDDVFDCLQTGPNGTLHFKLAVTNDTADKDYDAAQYIYTPQLDSNRDRALIEILPDFLTTEIAFPRAQLSKFYARVMRALNTEPQVVRGDESESEEEEEEETEVTGVTEESVVVAGR